MKTFIAMLFNFAFLSVFWWFAACKKDIFKIMGQVNQNKQKNKVKQHRSDFESFITFSSVLKVLNVALSKASFINLDTAITDAQHSTAQHTNKQRMVSLWWNITGQYDGTHINLE